MKYNAEDIAAIVGGRWERNPPKGLLSSLSTDTRTLKSGDLFWGLKTETRDGADFLPMALEKGAVAAVVENLHPECSLPQLKVDDTWKALWRLAKDWRKSFKGTLIAVTGSCGKTGFKDTLTGFLGLDRTLSTKGNDNNTLGVPLHLLQLQPEIHDFAVLEAGINQIGEMAILADMLQPDIGVLTNIKPSHLEGLGSVDRIAREKGQLLRQSRDQVYLPDALLKTEFFSDLKNAKGMAYEERLTASGRAVSWTLSPADYGHSYDLRLSVLGLGSYCFILPLKPLGVIENIVMAIVIALSLGIDRDHIQSHLVLQKSSPLRGQCIEYKGHTYYLDCYNANPASMIDSCRFFSSQAFKGPRLYVLGGMEELGKDAEVLHEELGYQLPFTPDDGFVLIGPHAEIVAAILEDRAGKDVKLTINPSPEVISKLLMSTTYRSFMLKGSRRYRLEQYLPVPVMARITD